MLFPLEAFVKFAPDKAPPKIRQFVDTIHARRAPFFTSLTIDWLTETHFRPAYKRVRDLNLLHSLLFTVPQVLERGGEYEYASL